MHKKFWTEERLDFIKGNMSLGDKGLANHFGCTANALKSIRLKNGILIRPNQHATEKELEIIKNIYANTRTDIIAKKLNRTKSFVYNQAMKIGVKKSKEFLASPESGIFIKGSTTGHEYRYPKGHTPANKGKTMSKKIREKIKHTFFKKGHKPVNTLKDGDITIRHPHRKRGGNAYKYIRISEGEWEELHRYNWAKENGPIPIGFNVVFKDGDSLNCEPWNLEIVSDAELMKRNTLSQWPPELKEVIKLNNKINKMIQNNEK